MFAKGCRAFSVPCLAPSVGSILSDISKCLELSSAQSVVVSLGVLRMSASSFAKAASTLPESRATVRCRMRADACDVTANGRRG
jgi:hypothetical protein